MRKLVWVKADWDEDWNARKEFVRKAIESGADVVIVPPKDGKRVLEIGSISVATSTDIPEAGISIREVPSPSEAPAIQKWIEEVKKSGKRTAVVVEVKNKETERLAAEFGNHADFVIVRASDWKIIPLENLIADFQKLPGKLLAEVKNTQEAVLASQTLEVGTHGVVLDPRGSDPEEVVQTCEQLDKLTREKLDLVGAKVVSVKQVGMGDRACVDTTTMMEVGEGMMVGSQAEGLFLIHSETLPSEFVEPRPFRVNAGGVHSYIRVPGGKTRYLSELKAGDEVLLVDFRGCSRPATIGRVKIERRPMVLVEAEAGGKVFKVLLQNAETINVVGAGGKPIPVTRLKPGDEILIHVEAGGRHFGKKVEESLTER